MEVEKALFGIMVARGAMVVVPNLWLKVEMAKEAVYQAPADLVLVPGILQRGRGIYGRFVAVQAQHLLAVEGTLLWHY